MIIQAGIIIIAAALFIFATSIFYSAVETSVKGDPTVGAHTMGTYIDFAYASSNPIKIYHEIPSDLQGNPGYGTVLYNPQNGNLKVNKYPQDFISEFILNAGFGEVTIEEGLTVYALTKWRNNLKGLDAQYSLLTAKYTERATLEVTAFKDLPNTEKVALLSDDFPYKHEGGNKWRSKSTGKFVSNDIVQKKAILEFESEAFERAGKDSAKEVMLTFTPRIFQKISTGGASEEALAFVSKRNFKGGEVKPLADFARTNNDEALKFMESEGSELVATMYQNGHGMENAFETAGKSQDDFIKYLATDDDSAKLIFESAITGTEGATIKEAIAKNPEGMSELIRSSSDDFTEFSAKLIEFNEKNPSAIQLGQRVEASAFTETQVIIRDPDLMKDVQKSLASFDDLHTNTFKPLSGEEGKAVRKSLAGSELAQNAIKNPVARGEITEAIVKPLAQSDSLLGKRVTDIAAQKNIWGKSTHLLTVVGSGTWKVITVPGKAAKVVLTTNPLTTLRRGGSAVLSGSKAVLSGTGKVLKFSLWTAPKYVFGGQMYSDAGALVAKKYSSSIGGKAIAKLTGKKLVTSAARNGPVRAANEAIECKLVQAPPIIGMALCYFGKGVLNTGMASLEYFFTYVPISHFIERSQDATTAVNQNWGEFSGHSVGKPIKVTNPNCESEPAVRNVPVVEGLYDWGPIEFLSDLPLIGYAVDFLLAPVKALEALLQTPSSQPVLDKAKEYELVENGDGACSNSHNYLLSDEAVYATSTTEEVLGAASTVAGGVYTSPSGAAFGLAKYSIGHPESKLGPIKAPFWGCSLLAVIPEVQDWTPGCLTIWTAGYVSMWADPELSTGQLVALEGTTFFLGGPMANVVVNFYLHNPIDSTNFFPYLSKSGGMINTGDYYYIENPYVISITKEFDEEGESIVTLDKEI